MYNNMLNVVNSVIRQQGWTPYTWIQRAKWWKLRDWF